MVNSDDKYLFLLGGNPSLEPVVEQFIHKAGGRSANIALLLLNRAGWQEYLPRYTDSWEKRGVHNYRIIMPDHLGKLDSASAIKIMKESTGIFIGGGNTSLYHKYYASEPMLSVISHLYHKGKPIAGCWCINHARSMFDFPT